MTLPPDLTSITVTATYEDGGGNPLYGYVTFTPSADLTDATGHVFLRAAAVTANVVHGAVSQTLACTDNANIAPTGWHWIITEVVGNETGNLPAHTYSVLLPSTLGPTVDLSTITPL